MCVSGRVLTQTSLFIAGGYDSTVKAKENKTLETMLDGESYEYHLIVVGGGSGGLACAKVSCFSQLGDREMTQLMKLECYIFSFYRTLIIIQCSVL